MIKPGDLISYVDKEENINTFALIISVDKNDDKVKFIWADTHEIEQLMLISLEGLIFNRNSSLQKFNTTWKLINF